MTKKNTPESVAAEFDQKAKDYESNRLSTWYQAHSEVILSHLKQIPSGTTVLDVGCGTGWLLRTLCKDREDIQGIGVDLSSGMVMHAKDLLQKGEQTNVKFFQGNWETLDDQLLGEKNIGLIVCANTLHYFSDPANAVKKMYSVLAENGELFLLERNKSASLLTKLWDLLHQYLIQDHVKFYYLAQISEMLKEAHFSEIRVLEEINRLFWKGKIHTNIALISARKGK